MKDFAALFGKTLGFLNRWNDTTATPLEAEPIVVRVGCFAATGWDVGKHRG